MRSNRVVENYVRRDEELDVSINRVGQVRRIRCQDCNQFIEKGEEFINDHFNLEHAEHIECWKDRKKADAASADARAQQLLKDYNITPEEEYGMMTSIKKVQEFLREVGEMNWANRRLNEQEDWIIRMRNNPDTADQLATYYGYPQVINDRTIAYFDKRKLELLRQNREDLEKLIEIAEAVKKILA